MSSKGQLTIPRAIRERHGFTRGTQVTIEEADDESIVLRKTARPASRLAGMFGPWSGEPVTLEEMDQAIAEGAAQ